MSERKDKDTAQPEAEVLEPGKGPAFVEEPIEEAAPELPAGHVLVTYTGMADLVEVGALQFRPGQPVATPSDVAESLHRLSDETFKFDVKE